MNARGIVVVTLLLLAVCIFMFAVVLHSGHAGALALPVVIATGVVIATIGTVLALRAERRRPRER